MTFIEAAAEVLRHAGKPLHYKEITELAIAKNLLSHVGKTPEVTMSHRLTSAIKKDDKDVPIVKVKPGVFGLREWDDRKGKRASASATPEAGSDESAAPEEEGLEVNALEIEAAMRGAADAATDGASKASPRRSRDQAESSDEEADDDAGRETPVSGDEVLRADLAARGAELFDDEEDDDQPILAPLAQPEAAPQGEAGRRRRRRRRRGRGGGSQIELTGGGPFSGPPSDRASQPRMEASTAVVPLSSADGEANIDAREPGAAPRPVVRDRQQIMAGGQPTGIDVPLGEGEELAGRELADAAALVLSSFDRNAGPAPIRAVAEALSRRGRLQVEPLLAIAQVGASIRADNLRRTANGQRPRFRVASGARVALTDWSLGGELPRLEQEVVAAVERYREASRRALLRRLQELPGHALIELALVALERAGMVNLRAVRRSGSPGGEAHFAALHKTGGDTIPTAIVIRKDGREIGRERVTDLRGALHHYGPASAGWLVTTGQCLSGAREEAAAVGAPPVALYDGLAFCKLLEEIEVGVIKTRFAVSIPDLELLEAMRG
ncbi:MAG TPA: HTH domain-containing protein [Polyangiaceae bacterium]|jgi:restriction endonuclease Mrr|nr:HTH domain-containing protein [Polyangiaceae bacterium]